MKMEKIRENEVNNDNLYILSVSDGKGNTLYKFGYSSNIDNRLQQYKNYNPLVNVLYRFYREDAKEFESKVHTYLNSAILREWYNEKEIMLLLHIIENDINIPKPDLVQKNRVRQQNYRRRHKKNKMMLFDMKSGIQHKDIMKIVNKKVGEIKSNKTKQKIYDAIENWDYKKQGKITQKKLIEKTKMNKKTIEKYYPEFKNYIKDLNANNNNN